MQQTMFDLVNVNHRSISNTIVLVFAANSIDWMKICHEKEEKKKKKRRKGGKGHKLNHTYEQMIAMHSNDTYLYRRHKNSLRSQFIILND